MLCCKGKSINDFLKLKGRLWNLCGFHQLHFNSVQYGMPSCLMKLEKTAYSNRLFRAQHPQFQNKTYVLKTKTWQRLRSWAEDRHVAFPSVWTFSNLSTQSRFIYMQSHDTDSLFNSKYDRTFYSRNMISMRFIQCLRNHVQLYTGGKIFSRRPLMPVGFRCLSTSSHSALINGIHFPVSFIRPGRKEKRNILTHFQITLFNERLYSKDTGNSGEDKNDDIGDVMEDMHSQKNSLKADPDLKAILDEIKNDFHDSPSNEDTNSGYGSDSDSSSSSSSSDDESANKDQNLNSSNVKTESQEEEYIYDYRYADDIEDFGFDEDGVVEEEKPEKIVPISLTRGSSGVFELDELLTFLDHLGLENVVTVDVPVEANYCDHMVIGSAKSQRHLQYINDEFLWIHKRKKGAKDPHLLIEGLKRSDWCAMDFGNIVLHVFYGDAREYYDIESLWTLGPDLDPKCQEQAHDPLALSEEQLFWMEASKMKEGESKKEGTSKDDRQDKASTSVINNDDWPDLADVKLDQEAGWNNPRPKS